MGCGDGPAQAWVSLFDNRGRDQALMAPLTNHEADVRDVFPAVQTTLFTYVVDVEVCDDGCVLKPQVWVGDRDSVEVGNGCQLTDGNLAFVDVDTLTEPGRRLGDHNPTFTRDLKAVVFSRNVGGKPPGPTGHHDLMRVEINRDALFSGRQTCRQPGTLTNLTSESLDERYPGAEGSEVVGDERYPHAAVGRGPEGSLLYTGQTHGGTGTSALWLVDLGGTRIPLTDPTGHAGYARWVVAEYNTDGVR